MRVNKVLENGSTSGVRADDAQRRFVREMGHASLYFGAVHNSQKSRVQCKEVTDMEYRLLMYCML